MPTNHHVQQHFDLIRKMELREIYASNAIRAFAVSLIAIFVPIYLINTGYTLSETILFYAYTAATHALFVIPAAMLAKRIGYKHLIIASMPFYLAFYALLLTAPQYHWPVWWIALFIGLKGAMFWLGYHVQFAQYAKRQSEEISTARIATTVAAALGPAIGGFILTYANFDQLIIISLALLSLTAVPFIITPDRPITTKLRTKNLWKAMWPGLFALLGKGGEQALNGVIWPTYLFFAVLGSFQFLGLLHTAALIAGIIFTYTIGKLASTRKYSVLRISGLLTAIIWTGRLFVRTPLGAVITDTIHGILQAGIYIPFTALTYDRARSVSIVEGIVAREIALNVGRTLTLLIVALLADLYGSLFFGILTSLLILTI